MHRKSAIDGLSDMSRRLLDDGLRIIVDDHLVNIVADDATGHRVHMLADDLFRSIGIPLNYEWVARCTGDVGRMVNPMSMRLRYLSYYCGCIFVSPEHMTWFHRSRAIETLYLVAMYRGILEHRG